MFRLYQSEILASTLFLLLDEEDFPINYIPLCNQLKTKTLINQHFQQLIVSIPEQNVIA